MANGYIDLFRLSDHSRMPVAENFRRRGKFEEIAFVFPNAPFIPITVVRQKLRLVLIYSGADEYIGRILG